MNKSSEKKYLSLKLNQIELIQFSNNCRVLSILNVSFTAVRLKLFRELQYPLCARPFCVQTICLQHQHNDIYHVHLDIDRKCDSVVFNELSYSSSATVIYCFINEMSRGKRTHVKTKTQKDVRHLKFIAFTLANKNTSKETS